MPNAPAASSVSLSDCELPGLVDMPKTATRESLGTISFRSSSRLPLISWARLESCNIPTWARQAGDEAVPNRIAILRHDDGNRCRRCLDGAGCGGTPRDDDVYLETHQLGRKGGQAIAFPLCLSPLDDNVSPFHISKLAQTLPECLCANVCVGGTGIGS